jgi:hypothetical protein
MARRFHRMLNIIPGVRVNVRRKLDRIATAIVVLAQSAQRSIVLGGGPPN